MNGVITGIDDEAKKVTAELDNGEEHSYFYKRLRFKNPRQGDKISLKKGEDGVELYRISTENDEQQKPEKQAERKTPARSNDKESSIKKKDSPTTNKSVKHKEPRETGLDEDYEQEENYETEEYDPADEDYNDEEYYSYSSTGVTGEGLAGFVFSVASFIFGFIPAVIGLVISKKASDQNPDDKFAAAGYKISKIQTVIFIIITSILIIFGAKIKKSVDTIKDAVTQTTQTEKDTDVDTRSTSSSSIDTWISTD